MAEDKPYHHGDLRSALLVAAEAELVLHGIEAFSLRAVAKRAGVSHAAPAHHFGDVNGLLTALAAEGYLRLMAYQKARQGRAEAEPAAQLVASGLGYIDFAMACPALFRLVFGSVRPDHGQRDLQMAGHAAYAHLTDLVFAAGGRTVAEESAVWAIAHGLADLLSAGRMKGIISMDASARDAMLRDILMRSLPRHEGGS
jgi:AcrR family transcriptional regulator